MYEMDDYFNLLTEDEKAVYSAIAEVAFSLEYRVKRDKTQAIGYTFTHRKVKKHILRFSLNRGKPILRLKFFASPQYSHFFHEAIRATIEEYDYKYTGCYGCGSCNSTQGYIYCYPDGREYYRCGMELIEFVNPREIPIDELIDLFNKQHAFYLKEAN